MMPRRKTVPAVVIQTVRLIIECNHAPPVECCEIGQLGAYGHYCRWRNNVRYGRPARGLLPVRQRSGPEHGMW